MRGWNEIALIKLEFILPPERIFYSVRVHFLVITAITWFQGNFGVKSLQTFERKPHPFYDRGNSKESIVKQS